MKAGILRRFWDWRTPCPRAEFAAITATVICVLPLLFMPAIMWLGIGVSIYDYGSGVPTPREELLLWFLGGLQIVLLIPAVALITLLPISAVRGLGDADRSRLWALALLIPPMPFSTLAVLAVLTLLPRRA